MDSSAKEFIDDIMDDLQVDAGDVGDFDGDGQEEDESFKLDFDIDVSSLMPNANFQEQMMDLEDVINEDDETEDDDDDDSFTDDDSELEDDDDNDDNEEPTTSTPSTTTTTTATATSAKKLDSTLSQFKNLSQQKQDKILNKEDEQFDIDRISKLSKAANSKKSKSSSAGGSGGDADADQKKKQVRTSARSRDLSRLPKETKDLISRGMNQYTNGELKEAFLTFQEVIRVSPRYPRTYTMMSLIKKDEGDPYGECDFLYIAAEIGENLPDLWKRCADLSKFECYTAVGAGAHCDGQARRSGITDGVDHQQRAATIACRFLRFGFGFFQFDSGALQSCAIL
ncbi:hypothetical protein PPL_11173 [Heterostelium album PN500]|uniref:Uncharacterized protein n=1 Tax=Heterostelium pallidum (strain ATCC 26659 / Pp 5 / PN500) TaxID=670386 RepID=D3BTR3_HETP5|nr:hypothetical protein PPL_11173 [Heterostelium album PN500]EFA75099.1 hypothetical protein PPL_11173 [Heterostelium album PN500]|eukprot:XP_020427233.1 hypothetical protein PPL_11173 [Heterostelium album PN500]